MADSNPKVSHFRFLSVFFAAVILILDSKIFSVVADDGSSAETLNLCNVNPSSFLPVPFSNLSHLSCTPVWNTFVLRFSQDKDHVVNIIVSAVYTTGWVGMGFSKEGMMIGSSAMVGWINKEGRARIRQYYLRGFSPSEVIADKGELPLTNVPPAVVLNDATINLAFQLKFEARLTHQAILLAFGTGTPAHSHLSKHDDKTTVAFDFSKGSMDVATQSSDKLHSLSVLKRNHGILAIVGWGVLLPAGAIVARYYRHRDPQWFYLHTVIQFVGFIIGLAAVVAGTTLYERLHANVLVHRGIGIFVLVLGILQIMAFFLRPDKDAKIRKYWNWYHVWVGRLVLFFAALNIVLGIQIGGAGIVWKVGYGFILAVILVTVIVSEALLWTRTQKTLDPPAFQMSPIQ